MAISKKEVEASIRAAGLYGKTVCIHSSLRSFGEVKGGAACVVDAFLETGCTIMAPTFSFDAYMTQPPENMRPARNGVDYAAFDRAKCTGGVYTTESAEIDANMGAIPAEIVSRKGRARGNHPLCSFSALGPFASEIISPQRPMDVYAPLRELALFEGYVLLAGVDLNKLTLVHLSEQMASRRLFRRWARSADGGVIECESGGCSDGFRSFTPYFTGMEKRTVCGESLWRAFPAGKVLIISARIIQIKPDITRCGAKECQYCDDIMAGGPKTVDSPTGLKTPGGY